DVAAHQLRIDRRPRRHHGAAGKPQDEAAPQNPPKDPPNHAVLPAHALAEPVMKLRILAVGRAKTGPEAALIAEYAKRLHWPLSLEEVEERRALSGPELKAREGELLAQALARASSKSAPKSAQERAGRQILVALDERGRSLGSREFAGKL